MKSHFSIVNLALLGVFAIFISTVSAYLHPAELKINNHSTRHLTVKIMKAEGGLLTTVIINSNSDKTVNIAQTGNYYLKTKATLLNKRPVFKKGNPFRVYVGSDGYSVLTITFTIKESNLPDPMSGEQISEAEFDSDSE